MERTKINERQPPSGAASFTFQGHAMSHETDENLQSIADRNPDNPDIARLIDQYRSLRNAYDTLQASIGHLIEANLLRPEDAAKLRDLADPSTDSKNPT